MAATTQDDAYWLMGGLATIKAGAEQTAGRLCVVEHQYGRGAGAPPHVHHAEDEWLYVAAGHLTLHVGSETVSAGPRSLVVCPSGTTHAYVADGRHGARFLAITSPAGLEGFIREGGTPAHLAHAPRESSHVDSERLLAAAARHGLEIPAGRR